ncbi:hypothetical protein MNEG_10652 [Monoraphidium neglectum]|uniref:Uncharacterized protein n=1 Tax=Monoraphidium neglectum TaxID=145388 RepID=A0A0D2KNT7_9CHLO|nr:hypothetical protein MNEG_10652 [Monoraphidium neglectum]KIY97313.1 hypothetical protein MNEG_10652 [Monoraphidium neglectum]|eukprot:XP_013896333.1 hypothetical protein MNEG_10652 [Monoraphidium neglectum]
MLELAALQLGPKRALLCILLNLLEHAAATFTAAAAPASISGGGPGAAAPHQGGGSFWVVNMLVAAGGLAGTAVSFWCEWVLRSRWLCERRQGRERECGHPLPAAAEATSGGVHSKEE